MGEMADYYIEQQEEGGRYFPRSGRTYSKNRHYYKPAVHAGPGSPLAIARCKAHSAFDTKWKSGKMKRSQAYNWLSQKLGIPKRDCHIVYFDEGTCQRVVDLCVVDMFDVIED